MWMFSMPVIVALAEWKFLNPNVGLVRFFTNLWSCSMMLLRYLFCRISISLPFSTFSFRESRAALLLPLLSTLTLAGLPLLPMALLKKALAATLSLLALSKKSTVCPSLSTALYKYTHLPFSLM